MAHFEMFGCIDRRSSCTFAPSWTGEQQIPERAIRQDDIGYLRQPDQRFTGTGSLESKAKRLRL
jgi:hypothetical protein